MLQRKDVKNKKGRKCMHASVRNSEEIMGQESSQFERFTEYMKSPAGTDQRPI